MTDLRAAQREAETSFRWTDPGAKTGNTAGSSSFPDIGQPAVYFSLAEEIEILDIRNWKQQEKQLWTTNLTDNTNDLIFYHSLNQARTYLSLRFIHDAADWPQKQHCSMKWKRPQSNTG